LLIVPSELFVVLVEELSADLLDLFELLFIPGFGLLSRSVDLVFSLPYEVFDVRALVFELLLKVLLRPSQLLLGHDLVPLDASL
jgi:hypothetical protein